MGDPGERLGEIWPSSLREQAWSIRVRGGVLRCVWGESGPAATLNGNPIDVSEAAKLLEAVMPETHPFSPDWTIAPAATLSEWMDENGVALMMLASLCTDTRTAESITELSRDITKAATAIQEVLDRKPLTQTHAVLLQYGTQIPVRFWMALEHNYRAGLAAGLKDVT